MAKGLNMDGNHWLYLNAIKGAFDILISLEVLSLDDQSYECNMYYVEFVAGLPRIKKSSLPLICLSFGL
jgi:hypothetical protein